MSTNLLKPNEVTESDKVLVPRYQQHDLSTGILHFGVGNFARAHQMSYMEELLRVDFHNAKHWAYTGVGVRDSSKRHQSMLGEQGYRYCIVQSNGDGSKQQVQIIGALRDVLVGPTAPGEILRRVVSESTRIVSLTITEFGYTIPFSKQDDQLLKLVQSIRNDSKTAPFMDADAHPEPYNGATVMGYIVAGLAGRRAAGNGGITVMSCDNIPHNGDYLKKKLMEKLESVDKDLKQWVQTNCTFPNSMVDSITPSTTEKVKEDLARRFGIQDNSPVPREFFKQWVIEDNFAAGRPAWEKVGAQLVQDVTPYELTKIRLLNISHTVMALPGILKGLELSPEAACDRGIGRLYKSVIRHELRPVLEGTPGVTESIDLGEYQRQLVRRFEDGLPDGLVRIAQDTSEKLRVQGVPAVLEGLKAGIRMKGMAFTVAAWGHYISAAGEKGEKLNDLRGEMVKDDMRLGGIDRLLDNAEVFPGLCNNEQWRLMVKDSFARIQEKGVDAAIRNLYPRAAWWRMKPVAVSLAAFVSLWQLLRSC
uniref:mannitol 2-dehydrogenase n=1 Tax=Tetraselmis sp. GSL018 TaxID=582737 RepID=A0A061SEF6_9CHLO